MIIVKIPCQGPCLRQVSPLETTVVEGARICRRCQIAWFEAMQAERLGKAPSECAECRRSTGELRDASGRFKMEKHMRDGIPQYLCVECGTAHALKVRQMYTGTPYGRKVLNVL
jgi:hypothetical protein